jgi:uncharacterized protein (TIGR00730 family)
MQLRRLCVYAGSSAGARVSYAQAAAELAGALVDAGLGVVYGGGQAGLMGVLADTVLAREGEIIGVIPEALLAREAGDHRVTDLRVVDSMHERKALMANLADAFVALPGGIGTVEELVEALTWTQLGVHDKPCALLNVEGYFDPLIEFLDRAVTEGFLSPASRTLLVVGERAADVIEDLRRIHVQPGTAWLDGDQV